MKSVHVHVHTYDDFEENKHPRADNGQFGKGRGTKTQPEKTSAKNEPQSALARAEAAGVDLSAHPKSTVQINKVLASLGFKERVYYSARAGYVYWGEGKADEFYEAGLGAARPSHLSIGRYIEDLEHRLKHDKNVGTKKDDPL